MNSELYSNFSPVRQSGINTTTLDILKLAWIKFFLKERSSWKQVICLEVKTSTLNTFLLVAVATIHVSKNLRISQPKALWSKYCKIIKGFSLYLIKATALIFSFISFSINQQVTTDKKANSHSGIKFVR